MAVAATRACMQDRSVFPFSLLAMKLSGMGTDTLFLGVLRRTPASRDNTAVRFWTTASGLIMSADNGTEGMLGVAAPSLVGQQIANLFTNSDEVQSFVIKTAASRVESEAGYKTQASMLHAYLPAVVVELTVQFGGAIDESDCRFLIIEVGLVKRLHGLSSARAHIWFLEKECTWIWVSSP